MTEQSILVVEDQEDDILLLKRAFRKAQVTTPVQVVTDGEAAIDYLSGKREFADRDRFPIPGVVLLDLKLPRKSGHEVLEWIRSHATLRRLPVVILTSSRESIDLDRAYDLGANSYLVKPVEFDSLTQMVQTLGLYWIKMNQGPRVQG